jgi:hypothetical protein
MLGALTAADNPDSLEVFEEEQELTPQGYDIGVSEGIVADLSPAYDAAIQRLRDQRRGLSARERLGALLVGFGQPTRTGKWQEGASNAASVLMSQAGERRKEDETRRREIDRLMNAREIAKMRSNATLEAARLRGSSSSAGTVGGRKLNADEVKRFGYAKRLFPGKTDEELVGMLYEPGVDNLMQQPQINAALAGGGYDVPEPPPGYTVQGLRDDAAKALASGAPRDAVIARLRKWGVPTEGL